VVTENLTYCNTNEIFPFTKLALNPNNGENVKFNNVAPLEESILHPTYKSILIKLSN